MPSNRNTNKSARQQGFLLLEVMLAIGIAMLVIASGMFYAAQEFKKDAAIGYGQKIAQYSTAVRAALVVNGAAVWSGGSPKHGVNWLKATTCPGGTSAEPFLACPFGARMGFGADLDVLDTIVVSNGAATPTYSAIIVFPGVTDSDGIAARTDLSGLAAQAASRYDSFDRASAFSGGGVTYQYFRAAGNYTNPATGAQVPVPANRIVAIISADSGSDIFLRRDGSNNMLGTLHMNGNDIESARHYAGTGNMTTGGNLAVTGTSTLTGIVTLNDNLAVAGDAAFQKAVTVAGDLTAEDITANSSLASKANLIVGGQSTLQATSVTDFVATEQADLQNGIINTSENMGGEVMISDSASVAENLTVAKKMELTSSDDIHEIANIVKTRDVVLSGVKLYTYDTPLSSAVSYTGVFSNGESVEKPACPYRFSVPHIFVNPAVFHANGEAMYGVMAYAIDNGSTWTVKIESRNQANSAIGNLHKATVFIKCS